MIYSLSYYWGDSSKYNYFDSFEEVNEFIKKYLEVSQNESNYFELSTFSGEEENRVNRIRNKKCVLGKIDEVKNEESL